MISKIRLYASTIAHLKLSQVVARVRRRLGGRTPLKHGYQPNVERTRARISNIAVLPELDFDEHFLARFDADAILEDRISLLHHEEVVDWQTSWHQDLSTPLWRFNLHYCEYLLPLTKAFLDSDDRRYIDKGKEIVESWIVHCSKEKGGVAWNPYVVALRAINWLAFYGEVPDFFQEDPDFVNRFNDSLAEQYSYLVAHTETDLLANHYFEDLKSIVLLAYYFGDDDTLEIALEKLLEQVREQILPDGMHFELSPMYHKLILEGLMRVGATINYDPARANKVSALRIQDMCDCLYSLERGISRTPLFNDAGDNVSKSRDALLGCAKSVFGIRPSFKSVLPDAGYAILECDSTAGPIKLIFDAGQPGPSYALGHAHCDTLSFECFVDGKPWIVNGGTNYYQGDNRLIYKQTLSHSTVSVDRAEQHECWESFRMARHGKGRLEQVGTNCVSGSFFSSNGRLTVTRAVSIEDDRIVVCDKSPKFSLLSSCFVFSEDWEYPDEVSSIALYSPEFGESRPAKKAVFETENGTAMTVFAYPVSRDSTKVAT